MKKNQQEKIKQKDLDKILEKIGRRKSILDKLLKDLGNVPSYILMRIGFHQKGIGFNKLYREIKIDNQSIYQKMAKSTLSKHLKFLLEKNVLEKQINENSPLKIKPTTYIISKYFREISKGILFLSTTPEDYLLLMRSESIEDVTIQLKNMMSYEIYDCIKGVIQVPENIAEYTMCNFFYNLETVIRAYRTRVLEKKEEKMALKTIQKWLSDLIE